jgi:hypothetical protein
MGIVRENINFERGLDPKRSMKIGLTYVDEMPTNIDVDKKGKIIPNKDGKFFLFLIKEFDISYKFVRKDSEGAPLINYWGTYDNIRIFLRRGWSISDRMLPGYLRNGLKESVNFERGIEPKQSMDIGIFAKINKITSSDLELLKIYTDNGDGKGHINLELFYEVYESSSSYEEYLERVKEVYHLLEPFEYLFGDNFESDMKKEMKEYVRSYLKNPKYNFAYNCDIMEEGAFDVFFSEIELPSADRIKV